MMTMKLDCVRPGSTTITIHESARPVSEDQGAMMLNEMVSLIRKGRLTLPFRSENYRHFRIGMGVLTLVAMHVEKEGHVSFALFAWDHLKRHMHPDDVEAYGPSDQAEAVLGLGVEALTFAPQWFVRDGAHRHPGRQGTV
jgi:hypothetical protein